MSAVAMRKESSLSHTGLAPSSEDELAAMQFVAAYYPTVGFMGTVVCVVIGTAAVVTLPYAFGQRSPSFS